MVTALGAIIVALILVIVVLIRRIRVTGCRNRSTSWTQLHGA
jgi:hypothetical protein